MRGDNAALCGAFLADLSKHFQRYANLGVIKPNGDLFCSAVPFARPINLSDRTYFRQALKSRKFSIGDYPFGRVLGRPTINFGHPIIDEIGKIKAVVFAAIDINWLNHHEFAAVSDLPKNTTFFKIDSKGIILSHWPNPEQWVGKPSIDILPFKLDLSQRNGVVKALTADKIRRVYAYTAVPFSKLYGDEIYVLLGIPQDTLFAKAQRQLRNHLIILALVAVLAFVLAWIGSSNFILNKINTILKSINKIRNGNLDVRTRHLYGSGELDQLAQAFDQMAESLQIRESEARESKEVIKRSELNLRKITDNMLDMIVQIERRNFSYMRAHLIKES